MERVELQEVGPEQRILNQIETPLEAHYSTITPSDWVQPTMNLTIHNLTIGVIARETGRSRREIFDDLVARVQDSDKNERLVALGAGLEHVGDRFSDLIVEEVRLLLGGQTTS